MLLGCQPCGVCDILLYNVYFCKQKTEYEMRISDWSSDVCYSDLGVDAGPLDQLHHRLVDDVAGGDDSVAGQRVEHVVAGGPAEDAVAERLDHLAAVDHRPDRKSTRLNSSH